MQNINYLKYVRTYAGRKYIGTLIFIIIMYFYAQFIRLICQLRHQYQPLTPQ